MATLSRKTEKTKIQWEKKNKERKAKEKKMVSSAMTTWYNNNGLQTRVILDFVDQNGGWGTLHDILHLAKKETLRGGHFMTYYTSSKYYGRTRMHNNIVPWARALCTKSNHLLYFVLTDVTFFFFFFGAGLRINKCVLFYSPSLCFSYAVEKANLSLGNWVLNIAVWKVHFFWKNGEWRGSNYCSKFQ